jgi:hypothetical protein
LRRGALNAIEIIFSRPCFCLNVDPGLFVRSGRVFGLSGYFIPVYSPRDKRGKSVSRNRGLGIEIRADNGRFHSVPM